jgi:hypothetical protein
MRRSVASLVVVFLGVGVRVARAQESSSGWQFMQDGVVFSVFNHQGGPRGADEFCAPNWWMGLPNREIGSSQFRFNTMFSLDTITSGKSGYAEIFQVGETLDGRPLVDRQHPHDVLMQLAAVWRWPIASNTGFTLAGGPVGEPALGPVVFMHRASAAEYPFATLSHHIFDSSHIAFGVVLAAVDHGPWTLEGSIFNGREPDENRWDFDFGALDSASTRLWYQPTEEWQFQASVGRLVDPEELEPGIVWRTTSSAAWLRQAGENFSAVTVAYGVNATEHGTRHAMFAEGTRHVGANSIFFRTELLQVETSLLVADANRGPHDEGNRNDTLGAVTIGGVRDFIRWRGFEGGVGAAATFYAVPPALQLSHGERPVSYQVYFRLRPPTGAAGRMWNMRMAEPMVGHTMDHQMPH